MRGKPNNVVFAFGLGIRAGCEIPITSWMDFDTHVTAGILASGSEVMNTGIHTKLKSSLIFHMGRNYDCQVTYEHQAYDLSDEVVSPHGQQRVFVSFVVRL